MVSTEVGKLVVNNAKGDLLREYETWYTPSLVDEVKKQEAYLLSNRSVKRRVFSPMLDRKGGVISHYDQLFMQYSRPIRWDWRLMAAQCYQESTFDPKATSWAGARGLMQIMPATADLLDLSRDKMYDPELNIRAAARYLAQLEGKFSDIHERHERTKFILAAYNGGIHHIRDAMALCQRDGRNPQQWSNVREYVLKLSQPKYYNDPIVKYGYMRGSETADYVSKIMDRWESYRSVKSPRQGFTQQPRKARRQTDKYKL
jgi:membrane-bound lytic murein transglycosylase F